MEKFKTNDIVLVDGTIDGITISKQVGTVITTTCFQPFDVLVLFNNRFNAALHNAKKEGIPMQCWWIPKSSMDHNMVKLDLEL